MATYPELTVRFPPSLMQDVQSASEREGQSLDSFVVQAVAERVSSLKARGLADRPTAAEQLTYLDDRAARARAGTLESTLASCGDAAVLPGDQLPDGWLEGRASTSAESGQAPSLHRKA